MTRCRRETVGLALVVLAFAGCGARTGQQGADGSSSRPERAASPLDGARADRPHPPLDSGPTAFCQGGPRAEINGREHKVTRVAGEPVAMDCCDGSAIRFEVDVDGKTHTLYAVLRVSAADPVAFPKQVDLASLPSGWQPLVTYSMCLLGSSNCQATAMFGGADKDRFSGWARIEGKSFYEGTVSMCLTAERSPPPGGNPPPQILRSVRLFAERVPVSPIP